MSMLVGKAGGDDTKTPRPKQGPKAFFIVFMIILLLILSFGSFLFFQTSKGKDTKPVTSTETPTPTPTSTVIYMETPPPQAMFYDTFINNALGWGLSNEAGYIRKLYHHKLTLIDINPNTTLVESLPTNTMYDNFVVSVDLTVTQAGEDDSVGIYVRGDSNLDHDYRIDFNGNNTFDIAKEYLDSKQNPRVTFLDGPRSSSALNPPGKQNTITVIMEGTQLALFINNAKVSSITDNGYTTGQIALFAHAGETSNGVTVSYSRIEVDHPPDQTPAG
jgi:hypothetical protein